MDRLLSGLGVDLPLIAAPMAGGGSTPALVLAAARAGGLGFVAAGYQTPEALAGQLSAVRAEALPFGVNVFAPNPVPVSIEAYRGYARALQPEAERYGLHLAGDTPIEDDDYWAAKLDVLLADAVPVVSFTFGVPSRSVVRSLRKAGTVVLQSVTSSDEARIAVAAGVDGLVVQCAAAGAHSATLTPSRMPASVPLPELLAHVRAVAPGLPLIATGGLAGSADVAGTLRAGAAAAMVGTILLRTTESGASATHRAALADPARTQTVLTRAFTGRPARGLRNRFIDRYDAIAPTGYPALHHLTSPLRKAAAQAGDAEVLHLWAGTGYREAREEPAALTFERLASSL